MATDEASILAFVEKLVETADLESLSIKHIHQRLETELGVRPVSSDGQGGYDKVAPPHCPFC